MTTIDWSNIMDSRKVVLRQTLAVTVGVLICTAVMVGIFAALGKFQLNVLWGALVGWLAISLNHLFLGITVCNAADRAERGETKAAQNMVALSSTVRLVAMGGFIPCPDHRLMPGTKFELVQYYAEEIKKIRL